MHGFKFRIACYYAITTVVVSCKVLNGPVFRICAVAAEAELQDMALRRHESGVYCRQEIPFVPKRIVVVFCSNRGINDDFVVEIFVESCKNVDNVLTFVSICVFG